MCLDWGWLTMFNSIGNHTEGERRRLLASLLLACAIGYNARQFRDFADPAAIFVALDLNR